jgi:CRISPR-associated protein Cmr3
MKLQLSAIDTWFFRDGTPFGMNSSSQSGVVGIFPPYPPTVAGAIRAALARRNGWDGRARWSGELATILGDGPADLGRLQLTGPCVLRRGTPLFPMPRHVAGRVETGGEWIPAALMRPAREHVPSDLGPSVRLPAIEHTPVASPSRSLEVGAKQWVTLEGLRRILRGELPLAEEIVPERALWAGESRVGIRRAPDSRTVTVTDGALYSTRHTRPATGVSLGIEVDGVPVSWRRPEGDVIPLGGEGRLAACETWDAKTKLNFDGPARDAHNAVIVALTPVLLGRKGVELAFPGARIVSACTERPLRIGGWDSEARTPLPLRSAAPPGSTWFCELDDASAFWAAISNGLLRAGEATATGFGLCAVGGAPRWEKTT